MSIQATTPSSIAPIKANMPPTVAPSSPGGNATLPPLVEQQPSGILDHMAAWLGGKTTLERAPISTPPPPDYDKMVKAVLFGEISNRDPKKQALEAQTILNTINNRMKDREWKNMSPYQVVSQKNQYQAYGGKEYQRYLSGSTTPSDLAKMNAIEKAYEQFKKGTLANNIGDYKFYHHNPDGSINATPTWNFKKKT